MSKLYFFRHAQASYLSDNYDQLSPLGIQQSYELGHYLVKNQKHFDTIYIGPLDRQKHTYEIVAEVYQSSHINIPSPIILEELREHEGPVAVRRAVPSLIHTNNQIREWVDEMETNPGLIRKNNLLIFQYFMDEWVVGNIEVPNIQSWSNFRTTTKSGLQKILDATSHKETIGVFTSGGTISAIAAESLKLNDEKRVAAMNFSIRNTSFSSFLYSHNKFNLLSFNELPHLSNEMVTFV